MNYKLEDIVDIPLLQELQDKLNVIYSFPSAIIDNDGKVLTAVAWQDICTKFHRINPESEKECIKSDQYIFEHLSEAKPAVSYKCPHGLVDNATPIIIDGKHLGNFFTGQFFLEEKPDIEFFKQQAKKYGFTEDVYLEAVEKVPVWTKEKLNQYLDFIKGFIEIVAGIGLKNLKEIEAKKKIKENEKLLAAEKQRLSYILEGTNAGTWEWNIKTGETVFNERWANIVGYTLEELAPLSINTWLRLTHPDDIKISGELLEKHFKGDIDYYECESRMKHKNGSWIWIFDRGKVYEWDDEGNPSKMAGTHQDITDKKLVEENLRQSDEKLSEAMHFAKFGHWELDIATNVFTFNDEFYSLLHTNVEEMGGYKIAAEDYANQFLHPDDSYLVMLETEKALNSTDPNYFSTLDHRVRFHDGKIGFLAVKVKVKRDSSGKPVKTYGVNQDITERKQAEIALANKERYQRALLDNFPFAVWLKDTESRFLAVNQTFANVFKVSTTDELIGKTDFEIADNKTAEFYRANDRVVMQSRQKQVNVEEVIGLGERNWSET